MELDKHLQERFGHGFFRPGQRKIVEILLEGRSALAVFPTGGGKSLCYQLPALLLEGMTLVVSPLIALMKDQVEALQARGVSAERLDSTFSMDEVRSIQGRMESGELKLLYVAPERLANEGFLHRLRRTRISLLAIDEAHCISSWGHNFRPDYLKLGTVARELGVERVLALTATATPEVSSEIRAHFDIREADHVQTGFHRPNLRFAVTPCGVGEREDLLLQRLRPLADSPGATIIYVTLQQTAEALAGRLRSAGFSAKAYHAGLPDDYRSEVQRAFMQGDVPIVVATIAFGMGIDKADVRRIFHYNLPKSLESYIQESGRAGRDGKAASCEILACLEDRIVLENFAYGDTPSPRAVRALVEHLMWQGERFSVSRYDLSVTNDIRPLVIATALTQLELDGVLIPEGAFYAGYRVAAARPMAKMVAGCEAEERRLVERMFAAGKPGRKWITMEIAAMSETLGVAEERIREVLLNLEALGEVVLEPSGLRHGYRLAPDPPKAGVLAERLTRLFAEREAAEIARLDQVIAYCESTACLARHLTAHFGDELGDDCGTCANCLGREGSRRLPRAGERSLDGTDLETIRGVMAEKHPALRQPRQLARFLCGLSSPATTRARLGSHDAFGALQHLRFPQVLEQLETMLV
ncbi:MAG: ATP-dependent DNA helicase RecQ [Verrucomicrobia bacterium]|jgi:ATP-dependent DNA helicase RecQ|nr:MAG: ATP-dependent DNA helicase RecQ [Verrucomicrobiota bacterium]